MMIKNYLILGVKLIKDLLAEYWLWFLFVIILGLTIFEASV